MRRTRRHAPRVPNGARRDDQLGAGRDKLISVKPSGRPQPETRGPSTETERRSSQQSR
jgi:hypothetical protein